MGVLLAPLLQSHSAARIVYCARHNVPLLLPWCHFHYDRCEQLFIRILPSSAQGHTFLLRCTDLHIGDHGVCRVRHSMGFVSNAICWHDASCATQDQCRVPLLQCEDVCKTRSSHGFLLSRWDCPFDSTDSCLYPLFTQSFSRTELLSE